MSNSMGQTGCIPFQNRFQENQDAGAEIRDAHMDSSLDAPDGHMDAQADTGIDTGMIDADVLPIDAPMDVPVVPDAGPDTSVIDSGDIMDARIDTGMDAAISDSGDVRDAGDIVDTGPRDTGVDTGPIDGGPDAGDVPDAGPFMPPCNTSMMIGPDIVLPVTPSPGSSAPFSTALTRAGNIAVAHLAGGHLYYTSISPDGMTASVPPRDVNPDLATMEIGNNVTIGCSGFSDSCVLVYVRSVPGDLVAIRLNTLSGNRISTENIVSASTNLAPYQAAYNGANNVFGVTYAQISGPLPYQAYVAITSNAGVLVRTYVLVEPLMPTTRAASPRIATSGSGNFLTSFQDNVTGNDEIYVRILPSDGTPATSSATIIASTAPASVSPSVRLYGSIAAGTAEYRVDWIESGNNLATTRLSTSGTILAPWVATSIAGAASASSLHSSGQFVAWNNASEFDIALFSGTAGSVADNQAIERSAFANFRPVVLSTGLTTGRVIYMMPDGALHMRTLSCR